MKSTVEKQKSKVGRVLGILVLLFVALIAFIVVYNNYSFRQTSRKDFDAQLDRAIDSATNWLDKDRDYYSNSSLMFMVGDMARMSSDPRLQNIVSGYLASKYT